jgi:hypothetical protein
MEFVYRFLGWVAHLNERLSHTRINLVPLNLAAIFILCVVAIYGLTEIRDGLVNGQTPRRIRMTDLLAHQEAHRNYVKVVGEVHPEAGLTLTRRSSTERAWVPMLDGSGKRAMLVELVDPPPADAKPEIREVTGMLQPLDSRVETELGKVNNTIDGVAIDPEYMLTEGHRPGDLRVWIPATLALGLLLGGFLLTFGTRYVVFRSHPAAAAVPAVAGMPAEADLRTTGCFELDGKHRRRFLDVPCVLTRFETGEPVVVANVDASSRFMGFTTQKRAGYWMLPIAPGSITRLEEGRSYRGGGARPALRFCYQEPGRPAAQQAILSCRDEAEQAAVRAELERIA